MSAPPLSAAGAFCPSPNPLTGAPMHHQRMAAAVAPAGWVHECMYPTEWAWLALDGRWLFTRADPAWSIATWQVWPEAGLSCGIYNRQQRLDTPVFPPGFRHWWEPNTLKPEDV